MPRLAILATGIFAVAFINPVHAQYYQVQGRQRNNDFLLQLGQAANEVMNGVAAIERAKHGRGRVQFNQAVNNGRGRVQSNQPVNNGRGRVQFNQAVNNGRRQHVHPAVYNNPQVRIVRVVAEPRDYVDLQASGMLDLTGYRLCEGDKWFTIPAGTIIRPNKQLRVYFFSSKERNHSHMSALYRQQGQLVADGIGISSGEEIELRAPSGDLVDRRSAPRRNTGRGNANGVIPVRNNQGGNAVIPVANQAGNEVVFNGNNRGGNVGPVRNTGGGSSLSRKLVGHWKTASGQSFFGDLIIFANHQFISRTLDRNTGRPIGQIERGQWNVKGDSLVLSSQGLSVTFSGVLVDGNKMDIYWPQTNNLITFEK